LANPHCSTTLATFEAQIHRTKNRLVAIPAEVQRKLRLARQVDNHLVLYSIRPKGRGRWNHSWAQLTFDNEFAVPTAVTHISPGSAVEVKIHRVVKNEALHGEAESAGSGAALLLQLGQSSGEDDREDGSRSVDDYLYGSGNG
jgi:hypothetical protein